MGILPVGSSRSPPPQSSPRVLTDRDSAAPPIIRFRSAKCKPSDSGREPTVAVAARCWSKGSARSVASVAVQRFEILQQHYPVRQMAKARRMLKTMTMPSTTTRAWQPPLHLLPDDLAFCFRTHAVPKQRRDPRTRSASTVSSSSLSKGAAHEPWVPHSEASEAFGQSHPRDTQDLHRTIVDVGRSRRLHERDELRARVLLHRRPETPKGDRAPSDVRRVPESHCLDVRGVEKP